MDPGIWFNSNYIPEESTDPEQFATEEARKKKLLEREETLMDKQKYVRSDTLDQRERSQLSINQQHIIAFQQEFEALL